MIIRRRRRRWKRRWNKKGKERQYLDLVGELRKLLNMKLTVIPVVIGTLETVLKDLDRDLDNLNIRGLTETIKTTALLNPGNLGRLAVPQIPLKEHHLSLPWKICKEYNNNKNKNNNYSRRKKLYWGENPERDLPGRYANNVTICSSNDATQSHT